MERSRRVRLAHARRGCPTGTNAVGGTLGTGFHGIDILHDDRTGKDSRTSDGGNGPENVATARSRGINGIGSADATTMERARLKARIVSL